MPPARKAAAKPEGDAPADTKFPNVAAKLAYVQTHVSEVKKAGWHDHAKYAYMQEHHVIELLRPHLREVNAAVVVSTADERPIVITDGVTFGRNKTPAALTTLVGTVRFICGDTGEEITATYTGQALDSEGKGSGKAQTYLVKSALQKFFLIPTDAIEDADETPPPQEGTEGTAPQPPAVDPSAGQAPAAPNANGEVVGQDKANALLQKVTEQVNAGKLDGNKVKAKLGSYRVPVSPQGLAQLSPEQFDALRGWLNKELAKASA